MNNNPHFNRETALRNLVSVIEANIDIPGNKQLLLLLGIELNDADLVERALEFGALPQEPISDRNWYILEQMGCQIASLDNPNTSISPTNIQDIQIN